MEKLAKLMFDYSYGCYFGLYIGNQAVLSF